MARIRTKIVLDADVVIHFMKGDCFTLLFDIFPDYQYMMLDIVYDELSKNARTKLFIDNIVQYFPDQLKMIKFNPTGNQMREYAHLLRSFGKGESACMIYCLANQDVLGSSNLRDIKEYCIANCITYLTTLDFLYYAFIRPKMTKEQCDEFMKKVTEKGSNLPILDITKYYCSVAI